MTLATHDDYLATVTPEVRSLIEAIRVEVERAVPGAVRTIAYQMPAYRLPGPKGRVFFYVAAFKKHIGLYPPVKDVALLEALKPWRGPKDNLIFPLGEPIPITLVGRIATALAAQYAR